MLVWKLQIDRILLTFVGLVEFVELPNGNGSATAEAIATRPSTAENVLGIVKLMIDCRNSQQAVRKKQKGIRLMYMYSVSQFLSNNFRSTITIPL